MTWFATAAEGSGYSMRLCHRVVANRPVQFQVDFLRSSNLTNSLTDPRNHDMSVRQNPLQLDGRRKVYATGLWAVLLIAGVAAWSPRNSASVRRDASSSAVMAR